TLTYAVIGSFGLDVVLAILLAVRGDWLGVVLVLAIAAGIYWFLCRHLVTIIPAGTAAASGAIVLLLAAVTELFSGHPYFGILFLLTTAALAFVFLLLRQEVQPVALRVGGIVAVDVTGHATHLAMLAALRDAGILSAEEFAVKVGGLEML
ncbi:MAG: hypothetical protein ACREFB_20025, partial [Stellaceae bacterium]